MQNSCCVIPTVIAQWYSHAVFRKYSVLRKRN